MYADIKQAVVKTPDDNFYEYKIGKRLWYFLDFTDSRGSWNTIYRCIYTKPISDKAGQILLEFDRPESILYTNLAMENEVSRKLIKINNISRREPEVIIATYHSRVRDELVNRAFKDFGTEQLPFKRFTANITFPACMAAITFLYI